MCFRAQWSPLFYLVAVHHVNAFIFQRVSPEVSLAYQFPCHWMPFFNNRDRLTCVVWSRYNFKFQLIQPS